MQTSFGTQNGLDLFTTTGRKFFLPAQIIRLEARSNYTKIYFADQPALVSARVLKDFESALQPFGFLRIHRSHLINKNYIADINASGNVVLADTSIYGVSRRKKCAVLKALLA